MRKILVGLVCALAAQTAFGRSPAATPNLPANALPVPILRQATDYSCGAAALLSVLMYWQAYEGGESTLYADLGTSPKSGTHPRKMVEVALKHGLRAELKENLTLADLRAILARGDTVILDFQAWRDSNQKQTPWRDTWEDGHYGVLVGLDETYAYFMDPSAPAGYAFMPQTELLERWHDYEDTGGTIWRNSALGMIMGGTNPLKSIPAPLVRLD